jgi:hypothetical protein
MALLDRGDLEGHSPAGRLVKVEHEQGRSDRAEQILREVVAADRPSRGLAALNLGSCWKNVVTTVAHGRRMRLRSPPRTGRRRAQPASISA